MEFRRIEYFIKIAEVLNFSEAAKKIHISHQALSKQIKLLESELGASLFERTTTKVLLTEVGRKMYEIYKPISRELKQGYMEMQEFVKYKKETLRIGYFNGLAYNKITAYIVQDIQNRAPELRIDILATDIGLVKQLLYDDSIDLAIAIMLDPNEWQGIDYISLATASSKIIVSEQHPWYKKEYVTVEELSLANMLVYDNRPLTGKDGFFYNINVKERICVPNADTYMGVLECGNAFGIVNEYYSRREGQFKLLELPEEYSCNVQIICAYKCLHPCAELFFGLAELKF